MHSPKEMELKLLYENVKDIAKDYYGVSAIRIFPYISPELYPGGDKNYLNELDIENTIGINEYNVEEIAPLLLERLGNSYSEYDCPDKKCDWYEDCKIIKWLWFYDGIMLKCGEDAYKMN